MGTGAVCGKVCCRLPATRPVHVIAQVDGMACHQARAASSLRKGAGIQPCLALRQRPVLLVAGFGAVFMKSAGSARLATGAWVLPKSAVPDM